MKRRIIIIASIIAAVCLVVVIGMSLTNGEQGADFDADTTTAPYEEESSTELEGSADRSYSTTTEDVSDYGVNPGTEKVDVEQLVSDLTDASSYRPVASSPETDLDANTLSDATVRFVEAYFAPNADKPMTLPQLVDVDMIYDTSNNSTLYLDVATNWQQSRFWGTSDKTYVGHTEPLVESVYSDDGRVQIGVTYVRSWTPDSGESDDFIEPIVEEVTDYYYIFLTDGYKVWNIRTVG